MRVRVELPDHPGGLEQLTAVHRSACMRISCRRRTTGVLRRALGDTIIDLTIETRGPEHVEQILQRLREAKYSFERVR